MSGASPAQDEVLMKPTHGVQLTAQATPEFPVHREMRLYRLSNGHFGIHMVTKWPEIEEPVVTTLGIAPEGMLMLLELLSYCDRLHHFPLSPPSAATEGAPT